MHPQNSTLYTHKQLNKTFSLCVIKLCTPNLFGLAWPLVAGQPLSPPLHPRRYTPRTPPVIPPPPPRACLGRVDHPLAAEDGERRCRGRSTQRTVLKPDV
jgi:hypothetical protein